MDTNTVLNISYYEPDLKKKKKRNWPPNTCFVQEGRLFVQQLHAVKAKKLNLGFCLVVACTVTY